MVHFDFPRLSMAEAEAALVEIWTRAEEYRVGAPRITFAFHGPGFVSITVNLGASRAAHRMTLSLRNFVHRRRWHKIAGLTTRMAGKSIDISDRLSG